MAQVATFHVSDECRIACLVQAVLPNGTLELSDLSGVNIAIGIPVSDEPKPGFATLGEASEAEVEADDSPDQPAKRRGRPPKQ